MSKGILPANAIVAAGLPTVVGAALAGKLDGLDRVAVVFFGDGAANQGATHEAMNLAAIWKVPAIFICENNLYSEMTPIAKTTTNKDLAERAAAYRMPATIVDANDVEAMHEAVSAAVARARAGEGPTFIEAKTYRLVGHMIGDSQIYRSKEEVEEWRALRDPIRMAGDKLIARGVTQAELDAISAGVDATVADAAAFASASAFPDVSEIFVDVFQHNAQR
jgi:pyruvate dehydrogenase E1 component alpha subunit